jgi:hypothetical protein
MSLSRAAEELVEEGFLVRLHPLGEPRYALTRAGVELAEQLLRDSPTARAYQQRLTQREEK